MGVPAPVEELDVADAALGEAACEEAVVGEGFLAGLGAVHGMGGFVFLFEIEGIGGAHLHAEGHFVLGYAGDGFGVAGFLGDFLVDAVEGVEGAAAHVAGDAVRVLEVEDGFAFGAALDALIDGGEVSGAPDGFSGVGVFAAGGEDDEAGEVLVFGAEAVGCP